MKYYVIQDHKCSQTWENKKIALVAHVNYTDLIDICFSYIERVPDYIDIYITTKGETNINRIGLKLRQLNRKNVEIIVPRDRGREISGLLVACREKLEQYEYIGFVHDKKKNKGEPYQTVGQSFFELLWENTLKSRRYIENIISLLESEPFLGLLSPPIPYTSYFFMVGFMGWTGCFDKTKELSQRLGLKCSMDERESPEILGMTFWCKAQALRPLFMNEWKYTDFEPEPMPTDNTISHAVERLLPYVAESQGYYSGIMLTQEQASLYECNYRYMFWETIDALKNENRCNDKFSGDTYDPVERLSHFCRRFSEVYIYGVGKKGKECYRLIDDKSNLKGFIVSENLKVDEECESYPVYEINEIKNEDDIGIILAMRQEYLTEVYPYLLSLGFRNIERYL